jgi:SAM-dependent methyltransferase
MKLNQDDIFLKGEGDSWFGRNAEGLDKKSEKFDWPTYLIELIEDKSSIKKIAELGCSNGWRLQKLHDLYPHIEFYGIDPSIEAIQDGQTRYPKLHLSQGLLSEIPFQEEFDVVIVFGVFCWVDRSALVKSFAEVDRVVRDDGFLVIGDFLPNAQERRRYHHLLDANIYTYKQDYPAAFTATGLYGEIAKFTNDCNQPKLCVQKIESSMRWSCSILHKSLTDFYQSNQ